MALCCLLACPNEIIVGIADELFPEDLVSFILTNKAIYNVSQLVIRKHQILLKQYASIRFGEETCRFDGYHPLHLLEAILQNPNIAHYPVKIRIGDNDEESYFDVNGQDASIISSLESKIAALGTENQWFNEEEQRKLWGLALLVSTNHVYHLAILLTMLPNLELIKIRNMSDEISAPIRDMVWAIAAANQDPASPMHGRALTKLVEISVDRSQPEYGENITIYAPFTALPSLRFLHGRMVEGEDFRDGDQSHREWYRGPVPSQPGRIEDVNFMYSAIGVEAWEWLFKYIGNGLKRFAYHHEQALSDYSADYDCPGIVAVLRKHANHSLRRLELTADLSDSGSTNPVTGEFIQDYNDQFVGDLKAFTTLRVLRLDDTAFQMSREGAIARLIDVLPASIRVVKLLREIKVGDPADLFVGLAEGKEELLPELKKIRLEGEYFLRQGVIAECEAVGIEIAGPCLQIFESTSRLTQL